MAFSTKVFWAMAFMGLVAISGSQSQAHNIDAAQYDTSNLDAGRLSWLLGREVVPAEDPFDPASYDALLQIDVAKARISFPEIKGL